MRLSPATILVELLIWTWSGCISSAPPVVPMPTVLKVITEWMPGWQWFAKTVGR